MGVPVGIISSPGYCKGSVELVWQRIFALSLFPMKISVARLCSTDVLLSALILKRKLFMFELRSNPAYGMAILLVTGYYRK